MRHDGTRASADAVNEWITGTDTHIVIVCHGDQIPCPDGHPDCAYGVQIRTLESYAGSGKIEFITASPGDYVIRGVKGEFYPCKPDIFLATYDILSEAPSP